MAQLDLIPDITVLCAQLGVFGLAVVAVKKLYVQPYLRLRAARISLTEGRTETAARLRQKFEKQSADLNRQLHEVDLEMKSEAESQHQKASQESDRLVQKARRAGQEKSAAGVALASEQMDKAGKEAMDQLPGMVERICSRLIASDR